MKNLRLLVFGFVTFSVTSFSALAVENTAEYTYQCYWQETYCFNERCTAQGGAKGEAVYYCDNPTHSIKRVAVCCGLD